jgi:DNA-binding CsgD family transcriptional regulator
VACLELLSESRRLMGFQIVGFRDALNEPVAGSLRDAGKWATQFGWPDGFMDAWTKDGHAEHFPCSGHFRRDNAPWRWQLSEAAQAPMIHLLAPAQRAAVEYMRRFELTDGITMTVRRPFRKVGCLSWINLREGEALADSELLLLQQISDEFFESIDHFGGWQSSALLSPRAQECLQFASTGLSDKQIAEIIGRSIDTVRFHMTGAIRQLNAVNRTHAVAIAIGSGLINPPAPKRSRREPPSSTSPRRCTRD